MLTDVAEPYFVGQCESLLQKSIVMLLALWVISSLIKVAEQETIVDAKGFVLLGNGPVVNVVKLIADGLQRFA